MRILRQLSLALCLVTATVWSPTASAQDRKYPPEFPNSTTEVYKTVGDVNLRLYVFKPTDHKPTDSRPAIVFFFGGGFTGGSPSQFAKHCEYFASRGLVAITADYRVKSRHQTTPTDSVLDGKDAMRYVRANSVNLGIDPDRIAASGGSAGGLIAACVGTIPDLDGPDDDRTVSYTPNAMVLFNPAIMGKTAIERTDPDGRPSFTKKIMPFHHVRENLPPSIMFFGTDDRLLAGAKEFREAAVGEGNRCQLQTWEGVGHGFFNLGRNENREFVATLQAADKFLTSLGYLTGDPTVDKFFSRPRTDESTSAANTQRKAIAIDQRRERQGADRPGVARMWERFDKNHDGVLEEAEIPTRMKRRFATLDTNQDGKVDKKEVQPSRGRPGGRAGEIITGAAKEERYEDTLEVGDPAPDFTLADPTGQSEVTLSSFQGKKPVVLIFASYT